MPERVVETVLHDARRRRKGRVMFGVRAPMPLVAAVLLIAVVAAGFVGGRIHPGLDSLPQRNPPRPHGVPPLAQAEGNSPEPPLPQPPRPPPPPGGTRQR